MLPIQTILHPTDFSEYSDYAFRFACSLARDHGARVVVLHVAPPPAAVPIDGMPVTAPAPGLYKEHLEQRLHEIRPSDPNVPVEYRLEEGFPATEILRIANEIHADLIVLGTHGRTGLGRLLMGSVAEQVVRKATCPVLTVKPSHVEQQSGTGEAERSEQAADQG